MNLLTRWGQALDNFRFRYSLSPQEVSEVRTYLSDIQTGKGYLSAYTNTTGERISPETAMRISTWFACLQVRWDAVAMLPFNVFRVKGNTKTIAYDHPAYQLLHNRPNPHMTATQFWKLVQQRRDNEGNCYCPIIRDGRGNILRFDMIDDNDKVKVYCSAETGEMYYDYNGQIIMGADMLHFKGLVTGQGKIGLSLTQYHAETIGRLKSIHRFSNRSIRNPGTYVTSANQMPMNPTQSEALKTYLKKQIDNYGDTGETAVLYNGFEFKSMGINPKDALYLEQINATKEDIFAITKVPPKLAQNFSTGTTYNNSEQQSLDFLTWGVAILLKDIEEECNDKLFTGSDYFCKFNEKAMLRLDTKTQQEWATAMFKIGVYSINDINEYLDRNPIEGGDDHYIELNNLGPIRLQDEILEGRMGNSSDPSDPGESGEQKSLRMINWLKKQLNGHAVQ